jgi:transcriptional regulator with XRE-family HTH domain
VFQALDEPDVGSRDVRERAARLREAVRLAGGNSAVARTAGMPIGTLAKYLAGRDMKASALVRLAEATGVRLEWLATGRGPMREPPPHLAEPSPPPQDQLGLTWQADPDRLARAYELARRGIVVLPGHEPDPRRLMQVTLLIYDELTAAETARTTAPDAERS